MRIQQDPLTPDEANELTQLLAASQGQDLDFGRGVFAAAATAPTPIAPTDWVPLLLGASTPDKSGLQRIFELVLRDFNSTVDCLEIGVPAVPPASDPDRITSYCKGYLRVAHQDATWKADTEAFGLVVPLAVLAGYANPDSLQTLEPEAAADPKAYRSQQAENLPDLVASLYTKMAEARAEAAAKAKQQASAKSTKIGRNDPCPCGSGRKHKKCCGGH